MASLYGALARDNTEIRLITVFMPTEDSDATISCSMQVVRLDNQPQYEALSYVWGDPTPTHTIKVNDQTVPVTGSLYMALSTLRTIHSANSFMLWVDALCINQQDVVEKSSQINLIPRIYRESTRVVGYLGEASSDSDLAIDTFINMAEEIRKENAITNADNSTERRARRASQSPLLSPQLPNESGLPSLVNQASLRAKSEWKEPESDALELTPKGPSHLPLSENGLAWLRHMPELTGAGHASPWLAMRRFLQRPYWKRIWIIQEAVLATRLYILCGTKSLSWDDLSLVCVQFGTPTKVLESIFDEFPHLRRLHLTHELFPLTSIRAFRYSRDVNFFSIFYVILMTSRAKATDPRDHIYGLLGIAKEFTAADYTRSVEDLYLEFSSRWIEWVLSAEFTSEESISLFSPLQRAGIGYRRNLASLPSWVVDLTSLDDSGKRMYFTDYQACGQTSIESAGFTVRGRNLLLKGAVVDTISQTWEFGDEDAPVENRVDAKMLIGKRSRLVYDIMVKLANIHDDIDAEQLVRTTFMALMLGRYEPYDTRLEIGSSRFNHLFEGFELFSAVGFNLTNLDLPDDPQIALNVLNTLVAKASSTRRDPNLGDAFEPIWTFFQSHYERSFQQAIFITNEGRLGVGTRLTRRGDVVCIIPGHTNTFLLRPGGGEDYELVCPAYVQGLMDGEAVGEDVDAWLSTLQDIEIQ